MASEPRFLTKFDEHLSRKVFHVLSGTILAVLYAYVVPRREATLIALGLGLSMATLDFVRLRWKWLNELCFRVYGPLMREHEKNEASAQLYYILGMIWAVGVLPKTIGLQAMLTLAWMDPIAGLFGIKFGRTPWRRIAPKVEELENKTVEGSLAGFLAAFLAGLLTWTGPWAAFPLEAGLRWPTPLEILVLSLVGAFVAVVAEAWPSQWDDNARIPFWVGIVVWCAAIITGVPQLFH